MQRFLIYLAATFTLSVTVVVVAWHFGFGDVPRPESAQARGHRLTQNAYDARSTAERNR